jgi:hypothetical protein
VAARQESTDEPEEVGSGKARRAFLLRLPPELLADLRAWASHDLRSLNGHIEFLLREAVRRRKGEGEG